MSWIRPRWKKVFSDLWSNKIRSILVIASVSIGIFAAGLIISMHGMISEDMETSYIKINPANIVISAPDFDPDFADTLKHIPEVSEAEAARIFLLRLHVPPKETGGKDTWITIQLKAVPDFDKMNIDQVTLLNGQWPPQDKTIVFDQHRFLDANTPVGGQVEVKLPDGKLRSMPVIGLVQDQSIGSTGNGGYFTAYLQGYITFDTLTWLQESEKANILYARASSHDNDSGHLFDVARLISAKFEDNDQNIYNFHVRQTNEHPNAIYVRAISGTLYILGFLVVFLSGFLITNTLSALLNQQIEQIGIIKTLGGRNRQIISIYMVLILIYSAIALAIALPFSGQIAYFFLGIISKEVNFILQGYREVPEAIIVQIIIAMVVPEAAGFIPILRGSLISVQEAVNGTTIMKVSEKKPWTDRLSENIQGISRPLLISLRNTFRRKSRLILTLITLTLGGAIFISTFNVQASMKSFINQLGNYFAADVTLDLDRPYHIEKIENMLKEEPLVGEVEGWSGARAELLLEGDKPGESVNIMAPPANSQLINPIILEGRWLMDGDQNAIALNENFKSRFPDLKVGDTLRLRVYNQKIDWVVVGFFQFSGKSSGLLAYANYDYIAKVTHTSLKAASYQIIAAQSGLTLEEQKEQGRQLEVLLNSQGYRVSDVSAGQSLLESATSGLNVLVLFLIIMAMLAAIVGSIGLAGTLSMNVLDRTREIAVMRAIGASDRAVMRLVIVEGLLIGTISWLLGSLLSLPISRMMWGVVSTALFDTTSSFTFDPTGFILWMIVVMILSIIASVIPARNAARLTIREALAYE